MVNQKKPNSQETKNGFFFFKESEWPSSFTEILKIQNINITPTLRRQFFKLFKKGSLFRYSRLKAWLFIDPLILAIGLPISRTVVNRQA